MRPATRSLLRLLSVQSSWTYERMGGIGVAYSVAPLLEESVPEERRAAAFGRSAEFFNSHPWLPGLAVGAEARAERDGVAPEQIQRLRAALGGPLGALGDRVVWAALFPALSGIAIIGGGLLGWWVPVVVVVIAAVIRWEITRWALRRGLESGMRVATVLKDCALARAGAPLGLLAAVTTGLGATFVARAGSARVAPGVQQWVIVAGAALWCLVVMKAGVRLPSQRLAVILGVLVLLLWQVVKQ
jgi:mannose/fructose/N-acetylgalactosamine-specific phosphotransferase system component IID